MDSNFAHIGNRDEEDSAALHDDIDISQCVEEIALLQRRLKRSEAAREEAEALLESKSRRIIQMDIRLNQKEEELLRKMDQTSQYLVNAQRLANVATFHIDKEVRFIGSRNFSKIIGAKNEINSLRQLRAMVHPLDQDDIDAILDNALQGGLIDNALEHDVRIQDDYGRMRWLRWSSEQKADADDGAIVCYGAVRDITLERRAERHEKTLLALSERRYKQLQKMSSQLSDRVKAMEMLSNALRDAREVAVNANKSKSRFLAMMSHDIRTPMNAILATLELLGLSELNDEQKRQLELAQNSGDQLLFLLADIIEYARSDGWLLDVEPQPVEIPSFIRNTTDTWKQLANKKDLQIEAVVSKACAAYISTDPTRIRQLLDNLISNAIKYTDKGTITVTADMRIDDKQGNLEISVRDTGNGISASMQKLLFEDLERGEHQDDFDIQGSGLGLSICRRIITAMNGNIGVNSKLNEGSDFWFEIPVAIISKDDYLSVSKSDNNIKELTVDGKKPNLLVAEDVAANRMVVTSMLEKLGCDYQVAVDGRQAVELAQINKFDAILMDVSMPHLNGMEATKIIREQGNDVVILAVTAFAADDEKEAILASGMNGLISKPISLSALHQTLSLAFDGTDDNDLQLYIYNDNAVKEHKAPVPDFDIIEYIDLGKLRHQILSVPADKQVMLQTAIVDDLKNWFRRFQHAWKQSNEKEVSTSLHALTGICNGFGAHKLLDSMQRVRDNSKLGDISILSETIDIYDKTLSAFNNSQNLLERRKS